MDDFEICREINNLLLLGNEVSARNKLICLLDDLNKAKRPYSQLVNHMIRAMGLYPYLRDENSSWDQRFIYRAFEVDVGRKMATLHREQASVLAKLLDGKNIIVSAPTSFGKSFIVDAYISAKKPVNVLIIVPTIALMDEVRRRLFKKFSVNYSIITAPDTPLGIKNIFIFPQERVFRYLSVLDKIDLLVIDEFYKISEKYDRERAPLLVKAIIKLSKLANQKYYLAPNIKKIDHNEFTKDFEFIELLNFNTVYLNIQETYKEIGKDKKKKEKKLIDIVCSLRQKTLIYAGTYSEIKNVAEILIKKIQPVNRVHAKFFAIWLRKNYQADWMIADLAERGIGVHNGSMHRCLSQLQIQLFERKNGFDSIVSTSSIIEGVNTSAQNVIIWRSKIGREKLNDFTYKNIIGRGGRMFKHFVGNIYLLDTPPEPHDAQLKVELPDKILGSLDEIHDVDQLDKRQVEKIIEYRKKMSLIVGERNFATMKRDNLLQDSDADFLLSLATDMSEYPEKWRGFSYLNSSNPKDWTRMLYEILDLKRGFWKDKPSKIVNTTKAIAHNWDFELLHIISSLKKEEIYIDDFFKLERIITFKLSTLLNDVNQLHKIIINPSVDISTFIVKMSRAFLPSVVYHLEEYGLPRMISKKIHVAGLINFEDSEMSLLHTLEKFNSIGINEVLKIKSLDGFDRYVVRFFFDGIKLDTIEND